MSLTPEAGNVEASPRYARFGPRLRGMVVDSTLTLLLIMAALMVSSSLRSDAVSRLLGVTVAASLLLYEPVLVSRFGGTLGHWFSNLRVVDDRNGGNVTLIKAAARLLIKSLLGWFSFLMITATRRNQALHDVLTRSTVQIRDPARAAAHQYISERPALDSVHMPSVGRRLLAIVAYCVLIVVAELVVIAVIAASAGLTPVCITMDICTAREAPASLLLSVTLLLALIAMAIAIGMGWRGRLFGARRK